MKDPHEIENSVYFFLAQYNRTTGGSDDVLSNPLKYTANSSLVTLIRQQVPTAALESPDATFRYVTEWKRLFNINPLGDSADLSEKKIFDALRPLILKKILLKHTQQHVAAATGINQATLSQFIAGKRGTLSVANMLALIAFLGGTFSVSVPDDDEEVQPPVELHTWVDD